MTDSPKTNGVNRDDKGRILPGSPPLNPKGRPEGTVSIVTKIKQKFQENPEYFDEYVEGVMKDRTLRKEIIQQLDGKPSQNVKMEHDIPSTLIELIKHASRQEGDREVPEEDS